MRIQNRKILRSVLPLALVSVILAACGSSDGPAYIERPVEEIYNGAVDNLEAGQAKVAADEFDEVERQHPYSIWATKAQLMSAYSRYLRQDYEEAILSLDRFIQLHPGNPDIAYAYYLKALSYYEQISDVGRDQKTTLLALGALEEVSRRFPETSYARDAKLKLDLTRDHLAGKEMEIGRFYLRRGYYLAAINRFKRVVDDFQTTTHVPEALLRIAEAYTALGIEPEARKAAAVLGYNYPGSKWYVDSYAIVEDASVSKTLGEKKSSFFSKLWPF